MESSSSEDEFDPILSSDFELYEENMFSVDLNNIYTMHTGKVVPENILNQKSSPSHFLFTLKSITLSHSQGKFESIFKNIKVCLDQNGNVQVLSLV